MHKGGWKPFWAALGAALLVLLPLVGGTVLLTRQMLRQQWLMQTAEPQRSVPIDLPKADDRMTLLLCTAGEQPGFVLFYLNAPQNAAHLLAVPGQLTVPFGGGEASLAAKEFITWYMEQKDLRSTDYTLPYGNSVAP